MCDLYVTDCQRATERSEYKKIYGSLEKLIQYNISISYKMCT